MERGTLYQLRNALNRRNVSTACKSDFNAYDDFCQLVVSGHIISATMELLEMSSLNDTPSSNIVPQGTWMMSDAERKSIVMDIAHLIVDRFVDISVQGQQTTSCDSVHSYACEVLNLGLLYLEFQDAIREGDGDRVLRVWKYLLLVFQASNRTNYSIEAFTLLTQYHLLMSPRLAEQLKWCRFINTHGIPGKNVCMDLHMEHLNRVCKTAVTSLGANKSQKAIVRVGKTIGTLTTVLDSFDKEHKVSNTSDGHTVRSDEKDLKTVVNELHNMQAFVIKPGRQTGHTVRSDEKDLKTVVNELHNMQAFVIKPGRQTADKKCAPHIQKRCVLEKDDRKG